MIILSRIGWVVGARAFSMMLSQVSLYWAFSSELDYSEISNFIFFSMAASCFGGKIIESKVDFLKSEEVKISASVIFLIFALLIFIYLLLCQTQTFTSPPSALNAVIFAQIAILASCLQGALRSFQYQDLSTAECVIFSSRGLITLFFIAASAFDAFFALALIYFMAMILLFIYARFKIDLSIFTKQVLLDLKIGFSSASGLIFDYFERYLIEKQDIGDVLYFLSDLIRSWFSPFVSIFFQVLQPFILRSAEFSVNYAVRVGAMILSIYLLLVSILDVDILVICGLAFGLNLVFGGLKHCVLDVWIGQTGKFSSFVFYLFILCSLVALMLLGSIGLVWFPLVISLSFFATVIYAKNSG